MRKETVSGNHFAARSGRALQKQPQVAETNEVVRGGHSMPTSRAIARPTAKSIASYVKKNARQVKKAQKHKHDKSESIREAHYKGHHIVVKTHYEIEVDGRLVMGHLG